jgi:hypothetical protein
VSTEVGTLRVVSVDDVSSTAEVLSGSDFRIGDRVELPPRP